MMCRNPFGQGIVERFCWRNTTPCVQSSIIRIRVTNFSQRRENLMKTHRLTSRLTGALVLSFCAAFAAAQGGPVTLKVGDQAPAMNVKKWVQGAPINSFEKG